ncbi:voltage-dependent sodium channel SCN5A [Mizugakiibacter sediminis]|uniref:Voltage-dependent sodium channel SCN5A n=1 Tax=Mizugakiibacter sediminis TaxID=1475481 RepID=A0A0K8QPM6_9GAMM|nr:voltage-dependent sodium channel SCN5A [Mizugakiibacter sediminis]
MTNHSGQRNPSIETQDAAATQGGPRPERPTAVDAPADPSDFPGQVRIKRVFLRPDRPAEHDEQIALSEIELPQCIMGGARRRAGWHGERDRTTAPAAEGWVAVRSAGARQGWRSGTGWGGERRGLPSGIGFLLARLPACAGITNP